jgi:Xaa-Pro dipeptidase
VIRAAGFGEFFTTAPATTSRTNCTAPARTSTTSKPTTSRRILPNTCFSVEPGIYLPEFGVRSEVNMLTAPGKAWVTGRIQQELVRFRG